MDGITRAGGSEAPTAAPPTSGSNSHPSLPHGVEFRGTLAGAEDVLSRDAVEFVAQCVRRFRGPREELLAYRARFQDAVRAGRTPDFLPETREIRESDWTVARPPPDLEDRRVEITGPVDRKMIIHALNSGARVYMADFEDAHSPTWRGTLQGQENLMDAVRRRIEFTDPDGRHLTLGPRVATLMVRPRGWHMVERHMWVDGAPVPASLFDFGLFFFHNARELLRRGTAPYFYLPKMEHHGEARLWDEVFRWAQETLGIRPGTLRATALIETLPAVFEMDEILWELRDHSAGLNCGRWDYIFSFVKTFAHDPARIFPDRALLTMDRPFLTAYSRLLIATCHRRGIHAMGGMAAQIPIKDDPEANARAMELVRRDKVREVRAGHDGTWVAHPGLVAVATEVFDREMPTPNQIGRRPEGPPPGATELLAIPEGPVTPEGARGNVRVALRYLEGWLRGQGAVAIDHRMEDAATVEIARSQLWQWVRWGQTLSDGRTLSPALFREFLESELSTLLGEREVRGGPDGPARRAAELLDEVVRDPRLPEFLTLRAYQELGDEPGGEG